MLLYRARVRQNNEQVEPEVIGLEPVEVEQEEAVEPEQVLETEPEETVEDVPEEEAEVEPEYMSLGWNELKRYAVEQGMNVVVGTSKIDIFDYLKGV